MEVHQHSHSERKKWTHYLWEFLMLFLAVFCGFLAEYQLEHVIEHSKEKEYMKSMVEDLQQDTVEINRIANKTITSINSLDTLLTKLEQKSYKKSRDMKMLYEIHFIYAGADLATFSQRTMSQLKNAGGLRLIRHKNIADSIALYDSKTQELSAIFKSYDEISSEVYKLGTLIFDAKYYRHDFQDSTLKLMTDNEQTLQQYANYVFMDQSVGGYYYGNLIKQKNLAIKLSELIKKEYHLK